MDTFWVVPLIERDSISSSVAPLSLSMALAAFLIKAVSLCYRQCNVMRGPCVAIVRFNLSFQSSQVFGQSGMFRVDADKLNGYLFGGFDNGVIG